MGSRIKRLIYIFCKELANMYVFCKFTFVSKLPQGNDKDYFGNGSISCQQEHEN